MNEISMQVQEPLPVGLSVQVQELPSLNVALFDRSDWEIETLSGDVVTFEEEFGHKLRALKVNLEPVQDLNGYDYPWAGGAGDNLLPTALAGTMTNNGVTMVSNGDGTYTISGETTTSSANVYFDLSEEYTLQNGDYLYLGNDAINANTSFNLDRLGGGNINYYGMYQINRIIQITDTYAEQSVGRIRVYVAANTTVNMTLKPMIAKSGTLTDFSPYTNICPISGWDSVTVMHRGKNLSPHNSWNRNGTIWGTTQPNFLLGLKSLHPGTYTISGKFVVMENLDAESALQYGVLFRYKKSGSYKYIISYRLATATDPAAGNVYDFANTFSLTEEDINMSDSWELYFYCGSSNTTIKASLYDFQIELGSTATDYEPYKGETITMDLGQTVYGGTLNVTTGVLTIDRAMVDLGTLTWGYSAGYGGNPVFYSLTIRDLIKKPKGNTDATMDTYEAICSALLKKSADWQYLHADDGYFSVNTGGQLFVRDSRYTDATEFKTAMNGVYLCYELATPTTVKLTPQEVRTLLGTNNIWANADNVTVQRLVAKSK